MIEVPLELQWCRRRQRAATAWLIPGGDAAAWLDELASWRVELDAIRIFPVPDAENAGWSGLFCVSGGAHPLPVHPRIEAYGEERPGLFLPIHARWSVPVDGADPLEPGPGECCLVHPALGPLLYERDWGVHDLFPAPEHREENWGLGDPGLFINQRLRSLSVEQSLDLESILGESRDDIGSEAPDTLPPAEGEPSDAAGARAARWLEDKLARGVKRLTDLAPSTASSPTWVDQAAGWAAGKMQQLGQVDQVRRNREIHRLLELLKKNAEEGLRHAIPMGGEAGRGRAAPGNVLDRHDIDFRLGAIGGGTATDFWDIPWEMQQALRERYLKLANRELRQGRHRRAAYIFAQLLGDYHSAADALVQGRHFREAAVMFKDHLGQSIRAAECLVQAGLIEEAVAIYEDEKRFETIGDLYRELGQDDQAEANLRRAVSECLKVRDYENAMRLLERKLEDMDGALGLLYKAWPDSPQAGMILRKHLGLLGRLGRHADTGSCVKHLAEHTIGHHQRRLIECLAEVQAEYPDAEVRHAMRDRVKLLVGRRLMRSPSEAGALLSQVARLDPADQLLKRDTLRFAEQRRKAEPARPKPGGDRYAPVHVFSLAPKGGRVAYQVMKGAGGVFYALGLLRDGVQLIRGNWAGQQQALFWEYPEEMLSFLRLSVCADLQRPVVIDLLPLEARAFPRAEDFPWAQQGGRPDWLPPDALATAYSETGECWVLREQGTTLCLYTRLGALSLSEDLASTLSKIPAQEGMILSPLMVMVGRHLCIVYGRHLLVRSGSERRLFELREAPVDLFVTEPGLSPGSLGLVYARGISVCSMLDHSFEHFMADVADPLACFLRGGRLVGFDPANRELYECEKQFQQKQKLQGLVAGRAVAMSRTYNAKEFALLFSDGQVQRFGR